MKENIDYIVKVTKINGTLIIKEVDYDTARDMIVANHYSKKWNSSFGVINYGIYKDDVLLGVAVYGNMMNPRSVSNITDDGRVIELNRLWIDDALGMNAETTFMSATFTLLKNNTDYVAIQSFADGRLGVGTIYKASNFKYYGYESSLFYKDMLTGETFHQAPLTNTARPKGFLLKNNLKLIGRLSAFEVNTYRYIYPLRKKVKIKLKEVPYPTYQIGSTDVTVPFPTGELCRLLIMYQNCGYEQGVKMISERLAHIQSDKNIEKEIEEQNSNTFVKSFINDYPKKETLLSELNSEYATSMDTYFQWISAVTVEGGK